LLISHEFYAYRTFLAIRNHFTGGGYDYFNYNGKTTAKETTFKNNKNYFQFLSLSRRVKHDDMVPFISSNFAYRKRVWITDLLTHEATDIFTQHSAYMQSATYRFEQDLLKLLPLKEATQASRGLYPPIISAAMSGKIAIETLCLLDKLSEQQLTAYFDSVITEKYLWPAFRIRYTRFRPFLNCENKKLSFVLDKLTTPK
jgi:hypothetical protein